jgi:hypothetical protein
LIWSLDKSHRLWIMRSRELSQIGISAAHFESLIETRTTRNISSRRRKHVHPKPNRNPYRWDTQSPPRAVHSPLPVSSIDTLSPPKPASFLQTTALISPSGTNSVSDGSRLLPKDSATCVYSVAHGLDCCSEFVTPSLHWHKSEGTTKLENSLGIATRSR